MSQLSILQFINNFLQQWDLRLTSTSTTPSTSNGTSQFTSQLVAINNNALNILSHSQGLRFLSSNAKIDDTNFDSTVFENIENTDGTLSFKLLNHDMYLSFNTIDEGSVATLQPLNRATNKNFKYMLYNGPLCYYIESNGIKYYFTNNTTNRTLTLSTTEGLWLTNPQYIISNPQNSTLLNSLMNSKTIMYY